MDRLIKPLFLMLFSAFFCFLSEIGAEIYRFAHITNKEGLPHQQVEVLMQDDKGMLWIGTRNGLSRYDGYNVVSYFNQFNDSNSINHNFIRSLYQDSHKRIWIGTYYGICLYQPATDDFKCYFINSMVTSIVETSTGKIVCGGTNLHFYDENIDDFILHPRNDTEFILSMAIDNKDRLFISTNNSIFYYDDASFSRTTRINSDYFSDFMAGIDGIIPLYFDSKGTLWMGRNGKGVMNIDFLTGKAEIYDAYRLSDGTVRVITEDRNGKMWLGTEKGITIINPNGKIEILQQSFTGKNQLNDNAIYDILCDKNDNIWIGTYFGGINVLLKKTEQFTWIEAGYNSTNIKGKAVRKIVEPEKNILWMATEDGGLNIYNTVTNEIKVFDRNFGHNIHELFYDETADEMWIGTFRNGLFRYNFATGNQIKYIPETKNGLPSDAIFAIEKLKNETVLVGTTQGLRYFDYEKNIFFPFNHPVLDTDFIYCLLIDKNDNIWVGTRNNGLLCIESHTNEIKSWTAEINNNQLKDNYITCLYLDSADRIWIGTNNGGLNYLDISDMKIKTPNNELSLSNVTVCSIIEDEMGRLWIGTSYGLYQINKERDAFIRFTVEDGLPINQFNFSSSIQAQNGLLYFGSVSGLISFNPKTIKTERIPFDVHLLNLKINDQIVTAKDADSPLTAAIDEMRSINFSYNQSRSFSIEYAAISLGNTSAINYRVRLQGVDDNWRNVWQERKFVGSNLPPGTYTLQIKANNSNEGWEMAPIKEIKIIIRPPHYFSVYAFLLYFFVTVAIIYFSYRMFSIRLKEREAVKIANLEKENMEKINRAKMDFFTSVSHELKTPLSLIKAPLKYISKMPEMSIDSSKKLDTAIKNTDKMVELIDELITFNKVESGNFQFYIQKGNPLDFIENIANLFMESASEKSISLHIHCENNGEDVWFSTSYVEKTVNNLLSNAIKFTPEGGKVYIDAAITDNPDGYTYLHIEVKDTGIGIVNEEFDNIFEKHYQTKRGHNVYNKGWGIGLAIVKKFTEIHKGNISLQSKIGEGSCFVVNFNVSEAAFSANDKINSDKILVPLNMYEFDLPNIEQTTISDSLSQKEHAEPKPSLLLVEDNMELLNFLSDTFTANYNVYTAENGKEALEITNKYPIDLVISDVMMPEMDGNTLCQNLKNNISTSHIPVILLTAKSDTDDIMTGYESGAEAYVPKPFDPHILELQVKNIIYINNMQRKNLAKTLGYDIESTTLNKFDKDFIYKVNELIEKNIENEYFSVTDVTTNLAVSRSVLHVKMKSLLNISIGDYIRKKRLSKARDLLREGYNVTETAYKTGFSDPSYFTKAFKKEFGKKPTEFQKN